MKLLKQRIYESGYTLKEFASKCNISYSTLYKIINNETLEPYGYTKVMIAKYLKLTIRQLDELLKRNAE